MRYIFDLSECPDNEVGCKGLVLKNLYLNGYCIPRSYVIPGSMQEELLRLNEIRSLRDLHSEIRLPNGLEAELENILTKTPGVKYVVRSSSNVEDLPFANAAGQYESLLGLKNTSEIIRAIRYIYCSLAHPRVWDYLARHKIDGEKQKMAILMQEMVKPVWSGVMYTQSPSNAENLMIEYTKGLGTPVVSGTIRPRRLVFDRNTGKIKSRAKPNFDYSVLFDMGIRLEKFYNAPQDIEWGWGNGPILFQSRNVIPSSTKPVERHFSINISSTESVKVNSFGKGLSVGILSEGIELDELDIFSIPIVDLRRDKNRKIILSLLEKLGGVVCVSGGILSHFAATCREVGLPSCVSSYNSIKKFITCPVVLDGGLEKLYPLHALDVASRQKVIFDWAWNLNERRGLKIKKTIKS